MRRRHRRCRTGLAVLAVLLAATGGGCRSGAAAPAAIAVDPLVALADQPVHLRVSALRPYQMVTVAASTTAYDGAVWRAHADFKADAAGVVDLATARPLSGTYRTFDPMGLFWSMNPPSGDPEAAFLVPPLPDEATGYTVRVEVAAGGRRLAAATLTRRWTVDGATSRALTLARDRVVGRLYLPPPGGPKRAAVLVLGGSEGGDDSMRFTASLLAAHGYPALALGYFGLPGLPRLLQDVPLEYLATGARLLAGQRATDPARLTVMGYSSGTEAALLLAQDYPDLVHGAVVYSPSASVTVGRPGGGNAWTRGGKPVPLGPIPLDRVSGPVLSIAGGDDLAWSSSTAVSVIGTRLAARRRYPHRELVYPTAGHYVGTFPFLVQGTRPVDRFTGTVDAKGGSRAADAAAQEDSWPRVLAFLAGPPH